MEMGDFMGPDQQALNRRNTEELSTDLEFLHHGE